VIILTRIKFHTIFYAYTILLDKYCDRHVRTYAKILKMTLRCVAVFSGSDIKGQRTLYFRATVGRQQFSFITSKLKTN